MAGAEEAARPVRHHRGITRREAGLGQAAQVRAGADEHQDVGLERARLVPGIRRLVRFFRLRILELAVMRGQRREHLRRALDHVDLLLAPEMRGHLARLDLGQIDLGGQTRGAGALRWFPRCHEGHRCQDRADRAGTGGGGNQKLAPTLVDFGDGSVGRVIAHSRTSGSFFRPPREAGAKCAAARPREAAHYTHADQR